MGRMCPRPLLLKRGWLPMSDQILALSARRGVVEDDIRPSGCCNASSRADGLIFRVVRHESSLDPLDRDGPIVAPSDLDNQADRIVDALMSMQTEVTLTHPDRVAILTVLDDPPAGLEGLHAVLLQEDVASRS